MTYRKLPNRPINILMDVISRIDLELAWIKTHDLVESYTEKYDSEAEEYFYYSNDSNCLRLEVFHKKNNSKDEEYESISLVEVTEQEYSTIGKYIMKHLSNHIECHIGAMIFIDGYSLCFEFVPNKYKLNDTEICIESGKTKYIDMNSDKEVEVVCWLDKNK